MIENKITSYLTKHDKWSDILSQLRQIILKTELSETVKWGMPVYTINNKNVVGLTGFKHHFGLWFFQGSFLNDKKKILVNAQEGKTKAMRHMKFTTIENVDTQIVLNYINEAIQNAKDGKEVKPEPNKIKMPKVLKELLGNDKKLKTKFDTFTKGRQNEFFEYILKGESPNDKYRK